MCGSKRLYRLQVEDMALKTFLYAFCGKRKVQPTYTYEKEDSGFYCEVRVPGFNFIGCGESAGKKEAQSAAARAFCRHLVESGSVDADSLPEPLDAGGESTSSPRTPPHTPPAHPPHPPHPPQCTPQPLFPPGSTSSAMTTTQTSGAKRKFEEMAAVSSDQCVAGVASSLPCSLLQEGGGGGAEECGNWTLETAKSQLNQFLQRTKQPTNMSITPVGPDHSRTFVAEMSVYIPKLHRMVSAQERAGTKKQVSNGLALRLVAQLYQLGVVEAARPAGAKRTADVVELREVSFSAHLLGALKRLLADLNITTVTAPPDTTESLSLLPPLPRPAAAGPAGSSSSSSSSLQPPGVVKWRRPDIDWHPWACHSTYQQGERYSQLTAEERSSRVSEGLFHELSQRKQTDSVLRQRMEERVCLPIASKAVEVVSASEAHQVVLVRGSTGCGKTTQVPQFILDSMIALGRGANCNVVVTQPRRISAVSVAERVAQERGEPLGISTGYSVRFESVLPRHYGSILYCTVGVLLRKLEAGLLGVSHVVVDEVHERDINTDFLLIMLRDMLAVHPGLRVLLMSATLDTSLFCRYFSGCAVVEVEGRSFPVQEYFLEDAIEMVRFMPPVPDKKRKKTSLEDFEEDEENLNLVCDAASYSPTTQQAMAQLNERDVPLELVEALLMYFRSLNTPGAVLIFLPGWNIIFLLYRILTAHPVFGSQEYCVLPCHSQLPREEQRRVFAPVPDGVTKVILATNIAESSITIDDVVYVIDCAKAKIKLFTSHNNLTNYSTVWAARGNLEQRCGRAGRVRPGYCFHLCSRARHNSMPVHLPAEMLRTPLHELVLSIKLLGLGEPEPFLSRALEPPAVTSVSEAVLLLRGMEALDASNQLTPLGRILARLPIEPRMGRMIVLGCIFGVGDAVCSIAACSSFPEPFLTPPGQKRLGYGHKTFAGHRASDHLAMLNAFYQWERARMEGDEWAFCEVNSLLHTSLRMACEARDQLKQLLITAGFPEGSLAPYPVWVTGSDEKTDMVVALLCVGLYPNVCVHKEKRRVLTADGKSALIHKTSVNNIYKDPKFPSPYFVFGEKLKTRAVAAKAMTMVEPAHLLLFGSSSVVTNGPNGVLLDGWIPLLMSHDSAALVGGLRQAVDGLLMRVAAEPSLLAQPSTVDDAIMQVVGGVASSKATPPSLPAEGSGGGYHSHRGGRGRGRGRGRGGGRGRGVRPMYSGFS